MHRSVSLLALVALAPALGAQTPPKKAKPKATTIRPPIEWVMPSLDWPTTALISPSFDYNFRYNFEFGPSPLAMTIPPLELAPFSFEPLVTTMPEPWIGPQSPSMAYTPTPSSRFHQGPQDSVYRRAQDYLNRGEYRRAADMFSQFEQKNPNSRYTEKAMYWRAFALYRAGTESDLRQAMRVLADQRERFATSAEDKEVQNLLTRLNGALAARGDSEAQRRLREESSQGTRCDREDMEVKAEALSALVQTDAANATDHLKKILARRDECYETLRRRAVYLLGRERTPAVATVLTEVARNDPSVAVRSDAIGHLAQIPGQNTVDLLEKLLDETKDEGTQRMLIQSLRRVDNGGDASALLRRLIEREDISENLRIEAISALGHGSPYAIRYMPAVGAQGRFVYNTRTDKKGESGLSDADATYLRTLYNKSESRSIKNAILSTLARNGSSATDQWLTTIVKDPNEDLRYRTAALNRLYRSDVSIEEIGRLYDGVTERELRQSIVNILASREDAAATDKLIEIAKGGTDPVIRRSAISALARKNDPRTTKLLLDLVEK